MPDQASELYHVTYEVTVYPNSYPYKVDWRSALVISRQN
jgi:hypothetical protein